MTLKDKVISLVKQKYSLIGNPKVIGLVRSRSLLRFQLLGYNGRAQLLISLDLKAKLLMTAKGIRVSYVPIQLNAKTLEVFGGMNTTSLKKRPKPVKKYKLNHSRLFWKPTKRDSREKSKHG
jgi:hypothetical protein